MQKARRHTHNLLLGVLFTFPSRYWYTIGLTGVFSLAGWSRRIHAGFHVSRTTQGAAMSAHASRKGLSPAAARLSRRFRSHAQVQYRGPTTPRRPRPPRFGLLPVRSPLLRESLLFSLPAGTKMFQFPAFASRPSRDHSEIRGSQAVCAYPRLFAAYHVLHRLREPRHPPYALALFSFGSRLAPGLPRRRAIRHGRRLLVLLACTNMSKILRPKGQVENNGFEPLTPCLQSRCSSQLS